jgi:transcriptional regulator
VYTPPFNTVADEHEIRAMVAAARTGWFVTTGRDGVPTATLLPLMWRGQTVIAHQAKANRQWREIAPGAPALLIVTGPQAYVSPSWYPSKAEHGRAVPTWNYSAVHLTGTATVHQDAEWLRNAVEELTDLHEGAREDRWRVSDAPPTYVEGQLRGIVGIELTVTKVEGKAKFSQNRSVTDRRGVTNGLRDETLATHHKEQALAVAEEMDRALAHPTESTQR